MNRRKKHAAEVLEQVTKQSHESTATSNVEEKESEAISAKKSMNEGQAEISTSALREQYDIILTDVLKLKEDVQKGYGLVRDWADANLSLRNLMKYRTHLRMK